MPEVATPLRARRPGLVCSQTAELGCYLVRDHQSGQSFELGEQEHFLLARLDGRHDGPTICAAFADRFGEPLSREELEEFMALSARNGLLQDVAPEGGSRIVEPGPLKQSVGTPPRVSAKPSLKARWTIRLLKGASTVLRRLVWLPNWMGNRILERIRHLEFVPRADDVFIVTYPRSGTTWMQMILYQLTTDGNMKFPHIAEYCPWFERSLRARRAFETRPSPRLFKSHLPYHKIPKGPCKYIYVARNGKDVAVSYYHLNRTYNSFGAGFDRHFDLFLKGKTPYGSWLDHVAGWWAHRHDPHVLFLTFQELKLDLEGTIRRIAAFLDLELPPEKLARILGRCSFEFMKQHEHKFDPAMESLWEQGVQLDSFLRRGRTGDGDVCLSEQQQAEFGAAFAQRLRRLGIPLS